MEEKKDFICKRCNRPVKNVKDCDLFEQMHWTCFHFEYEHLENYDVDEPCEDPSCPWNQIKFLKEALENNGLDSEIEFEKVLENYISKNISS